MPPGGDGALGLLRAALEDDPAFADTWRDVLGLIRAALRGDRDGARVILTELDPESARDALGILASLHAGLMRAAGYGEDHLAGFQREAGL